MEGLVMLVMLVILAASLWTFRVMELCLTILIWWALVVMVMVLMVLMLMIVVKGGERGGSSRAAKQMRRGIESTCKDEMND